MMDLKERLDRLASLSKLTPSRRSPLEEEGKSAWDLRQRLDRLLEPKKVYRKGKAVPIEELVPGRIVSSPEGEAFQVREYFPADFSHGGVFLSENLTIPTYPAHLLSKDERLKELDLRKALFLDTETTGLVGGTGTLAFVIGLGFFDGDGFWVEQFFIRDYSEEKAALSLVNERLHSFQFLVTFNGRYYDVPLLETRFILSRMTSKIREIPNFDLLYPSRRIWKGAFDNCRLVTLESQLLGIERGDDVPSEWIPHLYFEYLQTGDAQRIYPVFYHNRMDILTMVALAGRIHLVYHDPKAAHPRKGVEHFALGKLFWEHGFSEKAISCFETALKRCDDDLTWEATRWLSMAFKKTGRNDQARSLWEEMASWPYRKDVYPFVELAKYHEHKHKNWGKAIAYVEQAMEQMSPYQERQMDLLLRRKRRLVQKKTDQEGKKGEGTPG